jgi:DNA gyrase subunit A
MGQVYKTKVYRLPIAPPNGKGRALINILPLENDENITSILSLPEDEETWGDYDVMFATTKGTVRRNKLSDFVQVNRNGKIAMKLEEGEAILNVQVCRESDDVLLTTAKGQSIRFPVTDVRVFQSRNSMGVRGINLANDDDIISMSILRHMDASAEERSAYLKLANAARRAALGEDGLEAEIEVEGDEEAVADANIDAERYAELGAAEQFVLTISENGFGKRTSSYEYRVSGRGGKGIIAMATSKRNGQLVASFPVEDSDQIMLVTDAGKLIRCKVDEVRVAGRSTQGVTIFKTAETEKVVSVEVISEPEEDEDTLDTIDPSETDGLDQVPKGDE